MNGLLRKIGWMGAVCAALLGTAGAQACVKTPTYAFNGKVRIEYPRSNGASALLQQVCDLGAQQIRADVFAEAKRRGLPVTWVEVYGSRRWNSAFHDLIYKTRALGYDQVDFGKYALEPRTKYGSSELLVYANKAGRYIAMRSYEEGRSTANMTGVFIVYGN